MKTLSLLLGNQSRISILIFSPNLKAPSVPYPAKRNGGTPFFAKLCFAPSYARGASPPAVPTAIS